MGWWEVIIDKIEVGDKLFTPGRGKEGAGKKPFMILSKDSERIIILSGKSPIPLEKGCFEIMEGAFSNNPLLWLRVASLHDEPLKDSADGLIRQATGSQLARGNYVCAILEHCGLAVYSMEEDRKGIKLRAECS